MQTIVVGVDGSEGAARALGWAADDARRRGARLRVVLAWEYPPRTVGGAGWLVPDEAMLAEQGAAMTQRLDGVLAAAAPSLEGIEVEPSVVHAAPVAALLEAAADADLLVLGTRGHGGFVGLLLGSVGQQCVHHAPCPVVIVPPG
jgi:nucleotide-binding universal stress UspA family protein